MKKLFLTTAITLALVATANAKPYMKLEAGVDLNKKMMPKDFVTTVGVGYNVNDHIRADVTFTHGKQEIKGTKHKYIAYMANVSHDMNNATDFTPYVTAGVGHGKLSTKSKKKDVFAYQVGTGLMYKISDKSFLDVSYKYGNDKYHTKTGNKSFNAGIVYSF
jgi:opacity protein-like surface antigen